MRGHRASLHVPGLSLLVPLALLVGCSAEQPDGRVAEADRSFGLMSVTYSHDWVNAHDELDLTATAQFVRYSALSRKKVARLLALPLDPSRDLPAEGRCKLYDLSVSLPDDASGTPTTSDRSSDDESSVQLLEAGDLEVRSTAAQLTLEPRHFPGLLPFISGVIYGEAQADRIQQIGTIRATARGSEVVGPFKVSADAPALPRLTQLAGDSLTAEVAIDGGHSLELRWQGQASPGATTYLSLRSISGQAEKVLRCRPLDVGHFTVSAKQLAQLAAGEPARLGLELTRIRRAFFAARGLDRAELRVSVRDRATLRLR